MSIKVEGRFNHEKDQVEIELQGEIDIYGSPTFKEEIHKLVMRYPDKEILIDMRELEYIDSTGLGILIGVLKILKNNGKGITLQNLKPNVYKVFKITNLFQVFRIIDAQ